MSRISPSPSATKGRPTPPERRWRTVDIVVMAMIAALFGVVYWAWGFPAQSVFATVVVVSAVTNTVFLMAGPLAALVVRRPGAAIGAELLAALFEALISTQWTGTSIIVYGVVEGAGAELVFLIVRYRNWSLPTALVSGAVAGAAMAALDLWIYAFYGGFSAGEKLTYLGFAVLGGAVIAGGLSWFLVRALAETGVLSPFPSGREQKLV